MRRWAAFTASGIGGQFEVSIGLASVAVLADRTVLAVAVAICLDLVSSKIG
jgi:hypothetical protein